MDDNIRRLVEEGLRHYRRADRSDVSEEVSAHLEDVYADALDAGLDAEHAKALVREEVADWAELSRDIALAKGEDMNGKIRKILVPGLLGMMVGMLGVNAMRWMHLKYTLVTYTSIHWIGPPLNAIGQRGFITIDPILLVFFVMGGAVAAALSKHFEGSPRQRLYASQLPTMITGCLLVISLTLNMTLGLFFARWHIDRAWAMYAFAGYLIGWVLLPGIALYIGAAPFLRSAEKLPPTAAA